MNMQQAEKIINMLVEEVDALRAELEAIKAPKGPRARDEIKSERRMNDDDARRVLYGDLKDISTKDCAKSLNLSLAQIYSVRGGYTFKNIHKEMSQLA